MIKLIIILLTLAGCSERDEQQALPLSVPSPKPELSLESYLPFRVDAQGGIIYVCNKCPNKFCKKMSCKFMRDNPVSAICECMEGK